MNAMKTTIFDKWYTIPIELCKVTIYDAGELGCLADYLLSEPLITSHMVILII